MDPLSIEKFKVEAQRRLADTVRGATDLAGVAWPERPMLPYQHPAESELLRYEQVCAGLEAVTRLVLDMVKTKGGAPDA